MHFGKCPLYVQEQETNSDILCQLGLLTMLMEREIDGKSYVDRKRLVYIVQIFKRVGYDGYAEKKILSQNRDT